MKVYFGFDDTDHHDSPYGTGKLVRWFQKALPGGCECVGVVRQQLFLSDDIPYTSHNSSACMIVEMVDGALLDRSIESAASHINTYAIPGSDPGLCVVTERDSSLDEIVAYGHYCTHAVSSQREALQVAGKVHLSGHGGTNDGIIGAVAAVGLTMSGWSGRYIELDRLRDWPGQTTVSEIRSGGVEVVSTDRDTRIPAPGDTVITNGWLRPRLMGHRPVLLVQPKAPAVWENIYHKRKKPAQSAA